jgi:uncharacterized membrane protein
MKKYFITGLVLLLPLVVTIAVILFLVDLFTKPFISVVSEALHNSAIFTDGIFIFSGPQLVSYLSRILILIALFGCTVALGFIARWLFLKSLFRYADRILSKIPLVSTVYKTSQDIINTVFISDKKSFQKVVMVEFPRPGVFVIGLISRESPPTCCSATGKKLISVLVPTTPNPTTGFLMMFEEDQLINIDMKPEDAIKYIVSCGVIIPEQQNNPSIQKNL